MTPALITGKATGRAIMCGACGQRWPRFYDRPGGMLEGFHRCPRCDNGQVYVCMFYGAAERCPVETRSYQGHHGRYCTACEHRYGESHGRQSKLSACPKCHQTEPVIRVYTFGVAFCHKDPPPSPPHQQRPWEPCTGESCGHYEATP